MATNERDQDEQTNGDVIIEVEDVSVTFDMNRGTSRVLNNVTLDIYRDETIGIVGESGSGKSMFAASLMDAVDEPGQLSGDITYYLDEDRPRHLLDLSSEELRRLRWEDVSMVFQGAMSSFNPTQTIGTQFEQTLEAHDSDINEGMDRARRLLSDLYLDPERVLHAYPHELSGGMSQRALIALSLLLEPDVLIMDEPTAALDLLMQQSIISLLEEVKETYDFTLIFITHDLPLVGRLCDRLAVLYAFEFVEIGPVEEVILNAKHPYTRALMNATPNLQTPMDMMREIEGSSPDPVNVPAGCSYHPRCPLADELCIQSDPPLEDAVPGHDVACHHWEDVEEAIPLSLEEVEE